MAITAAEFNVLFGSYKDRQRSFDLLLQRAKLHENPREVVWMALNALDYVGKALSDRRPAVEGLQTESEDVPRWASSYVPRLVEKILADLD